MTDTILDSGGLPPQLGTMLDWVVLRLAPVLGALVIPVLAVGVVYVGVRMYGASRKASGARYPRNWPRLSEIVTKKEIAQGYYKAGPKKIVKNRKFAGAARIGILYPAWRPYEMIPKIWPLTRLRNWILWLMGKQLWVPYNKRLQHFGVLGATGKGKSTKFAVPHIAYGALEGNSSYFVIDVKSPQFARMFGDLYKDNGKAVYFFDPFRIEETLGFEPLWRGSEEELNEIAQVITTYSPSGSSPSESGNSEFFNLAAQRTLRSFLELAQYWPRQHCNLPSVYQLSAAGLETIQKALQVPFSVQAPSFEALKEAAAYLLAAEGGDLRVETRTDEGKKHLSTLNKSGYYASYLVRAGREYVRKGESVDDVMARLVEELDRDYRTREQKYRKMQEATKEFVEMPPETAGSVMSTLGNKLLYFKDKNLSRAFSRDELNLGMLTRKPCLVLIGAPMAKLGVGSLFVASLISNLAMNSVFQRGAAIEAGRPGIWKGNVFYYFDEFPQINITKASQALATFRGFLAGLFLIYQDRGQIKKGYGEDFTNIEANLVHQVLLQGAHIDTCEFYNKSLGNVEVERVTTSGSGEGASTSTSSERVNLMEANDIRDMRLNGKVVADLALSVGGETPPFPFLPISFWDDPLLRKLLRLKRTVKKPNAWAFWRWEDRWDADLEAVDPYLDRKKRYDADGREVKDVARRLDDDLGQIVDFLIGKPTEKVERVGQDGKKRVRSLPIYDELVVPDLNLAAITGAAGSPGAPKPGHGFGMPPGTAPSPFGGKPGGVGMPQADRPAPAVPPSAIAPIYGTDMRELIHNDFEVSPMIEDAPVPTGTISERLNSNQSDE